MQVNTHTITTDTHTITAGYSIDCIDDLAVDINGDTLDDIIANMVDFWNDSYEMATPFEVGRIADNGGDIEVTLTGEVYAADEDGNLTEDMSRIDVTILATANE